VTEIVIIGAGMAGASLAAALIPHASVLILEAENRPGYHSTGRSAAFWSESYGGPLIRPLTTASGPFLREHGFLSSRGAIHLANAEDEHALGMLAEDFANLPMRALGRAELEAAIPGLRPGWDRGLSEPGCADIDVAALHAFYLRGTKVVTYARLLRASRQGRWRIETTAGDFEADILVDAAGAWADEVAILCGEAPLGIQPYRRTIAQLRVAPPVPADLPLVVDAAGRFYFKPQAGGRLWLSPHDETLCDPCDCAPEEIDIAIAIDRLERVVDWKVERVEHSWGGLRSFAPDRLPVYGYSQSGSGFFWCAGQGGFGIQTAPAAAKLAAALLLGETPELDPHPYRPSRFG
jgi:D-arginine dehydrogenase